MRLETEGVWKPVALVGKKLVHKKDSQLWTNFCMYLKISSHAVSSPYCILGYINGMYFLNVSLLETLLR